VSAAAVTDAQAESLFRALGREDLIGDERFATLPARSANIQALFEELTLENPPPMAEVIERLEKEDVPCGPVVPRSQVADHPQVRASESLVESEHPVLGRMREPRPPARFERTPAGIARPAPRLGEHTDEVLARSLGLSADAIAELRAAGVVA